jgi:predicted DNA-binding transcriptional regulator AlpA
MPTMTRTTCPLLLLDDVAARLRVCKATVRSWVAAGILPPPIRLGPRRLYWTEEDIEKVLRSGRCVAGQGRR